MTVIRDDESPRCLVLGRKCGLVMFWFCAEKGRSGLMRFGVFVVRGWVMLGGRCTCMLGCTLFLIVLVIVLVALSLGLMCENVVDIGLGIVFVPIAEPMVDIALGSVLVVSMIDVELGIVFVVPIVDIALGIRIVGIALGIVFTILSVDIVFRGVCLFSAWRYSNKDLRAHVRVTDVATGSAC
eukprot:268261-Amorphochlora_amoeboformis.AAC.2